VLAVRNLDASTRYFIDVLGFSRDPIEAQGWSFLSRDHFHVMLGECPDERPAAELGNHSYVVHVLMQGLDEYYRDILERGGLTLFEPTDRPWGLREFGVVTPEGHRMVFAEPIA
jgi:uncharacterized glyoxalase superfamily protein PhnB